MRYVLGIDQGSSKTHAAVCDTDGQILGVGHAGGGYPVRDMPGALACMREAATAALHTAGLFSSLIDMVYGGVTSADWPDEYDLIQRHAAALALGTTTRITNDCLIALRSGTPGSGAIVVAGTGANCAVRAPNGDTLVYHYYHDDELQGGTALGQQALWAVYRAATHRAHAPWLTAAVLGHFNVPSVDALRRAHVEQPFTPDMVKHVAPLVFVAAQHGDQAASTILRRFGEGLADMVIAGLRHFDMLALPVDVVVSGSVFKGAGTLLDEVMLAQLHMAAPHARLINARYEPVVGALLLGLEALGVPATSDLMAAIDAGSQRHGLIRSKTGLSTANKRS